MTNAVRAWDARDIEELHETVERLQGEVEKLTASRRRLVLAGDAERRRIERVLHEGVQQDLVALAVNLQLAEALVESDPDEVRKLMRSMARDLKDSLEETAQLALRLHPPMLGSVDLRSALRAAAAGQGIRASIEVGPVDEHTGEILRTAYLCCVEVLERVGKDGHATIGIRTEDGALAFEVTAHPHVQLDDLRDRVEALGGRLTIASAPDGATRMAGWL